MSEEESKKESRVRCKYCLAQFSPTDHKFAEHKKRVSAAEWCCPNCSKKIQNLVRYCRIIALMFVIITFSMIIADTKTSSRPVFTVIINPLSYIVNLFAIIAIFITRKPWTSILVQILVWIAVGLVYIKSFFFITFIYEGPSLGPLVACVLQAAAITAYLVWVFYLAPKKLIGT
jgi:hypothetical protein